MGNEAVCTIMRNIAAGLRPAYVTVSLAQFLQFFAPVTMDVPGTLKQNIVEPQPKPWERSFVTQLSAIAKREPLRRFRRAARERHKMVMFLHCAGWKNVDIAKAMGYSNQAVTTVIQSQHPELLAIKDRAQQLVESNTTDVLLRFRQEANKSVTTLVEVRDQTGDIGQRRMAARDILDRAGYSVVKKQINFNSEIPIEKLEGIIEQIQDANEVENRKSQWAITNPNEVVINANP